MLSELLRRKISKQFLLLLIVKESYRISLLQDNVLPKLFYLSSHPFVYISSLLSSTIFFYVSFVQAVQGATFGKSTVVRGIHIDPEVNHFGKHDGTSCTIMTAKVFGASATDCKAL